MSRRVNLNCKLGEVRVLSLVIVWWLAAGASALGMDDLYPNGVSDVWEVAYGIFNPSPENDADHDGISDYDEARHGTNPHEAESAFSLQVNSFPSTVTLITWHAMSGRVYVVQSSSNESDWIDVSEEIQGHDTEASFAIPQGASPEIAYRVTAYLGAPLPNYAKNYLKGRDTDGDGQTDWAEWVSGSSVIDPNEIFTANSSQNLPSVTLSWSTQKGIDYDLEVLQNGGWIHFSGPFEGTGQVVNYSVSAESQNEVFRLRMEMPDEDDDGLADWEELLLGMSPLDDYSASIIQHDFDFAVENLITGGELTLETVKPTIRGIGERAVVRIRRTGGFAPVTVNMSVTGDWAMDSLDPIVLATGVNSVEIELVASPGSSSGYVTLLPASNYELNGVTVKAVTLLNENLINVQNHGALGNGTTDDTTAIQLALIELENDPTKNGLYFPTGTYRMTKITSDFDSPYGWKRMLELGYRKDLSGRDLVLKGDPGACLFSDVSPTRVNMFIIRGGFRSLIIDGLRFEQDSVPLSEAPGSEPNFSDALTISADGLRTIEGIFIENCEFVNCHRAISVYGQGYDIRGNGGRFVMDNCQVLNPYGANTENGVSWGGGQQIYLAAWVAEACYRNCVFDGGGADMTDQVTTPGGKVKDGCHFGSPLRLTFSDNIVRRMGVEAVHQTNETTFMGANKEAFLMPAPDDVSVVSVWVTDMPSTWRAGESIIIRTPGAQGNGATNNRLTVRGFDSNLSRVLLSNPGVIGNLPEGSQVGSGKLIYLDDRPEPTTAYFRRNLFYGMLPPGGQAFHEQAAIVSQAKSVVEGNVVIDYANGVLSRPVVHTPAFPAAYGMTVKGNLIITRHSPSFPEVFTYGINVSGGREKILDNFILCPVSWKTVGIAVRSKDTWMWRNTVLADEIQINGLHSENRATGIGNGYDASGMSVWENCTRGFDLGVGSLGNAGWASFRLRDHTSILDVVPVQTAAREPW